MLRSPPDRAGAARSGAHPGVAVLHDRRPARRLRGRSQGRWHRQRSMGVTVGTHGGRSRLESGSATRSASCPLEQLVERWRMCVLDQAGEEVFLERLAGLRSAAPERRVHIVRHVLDLNARHSTTVAPLWRHDTSSGATGRPSVRSASSTASANAAGARRSARRGLIGPRRGGASGKERRRVIAPWSLGETVALAPSVLRHPHSDVPRRPRAPNDQSADRVVPQDLSRMKRTR